MTTRLRVPELADAGAIADLHVETWRETYAHLLPDGFFTPDYIESRHRMWWAVLTERNPAHTVHVVESGASVIGFAWAGATQDPNEPRDRVLYAIYVLARHHGTGAGQALLERTLGAEPAMLWVAKQNPRAIAFYERNGFRADGAE